MGAHIRQNRRVLVVPFQIHQLMALQPQAAMRWHAFSPKAVGSPPKAAPNSSSPSGPEASPRLRTQVPGNHFAHSAPASWNTYFVLARTGCQATQEAPGSPMSAPPEYGYGALFPFTRVPFWVPFFLTHTHMQKNSTNRTAQPSSSSHKETPHICMSCFTSRNGNIKDLYSREIIRT